MRRRPGRWQGALRPWPSSSSPVLYLGYLVCAVPIAAIFAFAVYGIGMPVAYFVSLWRVLVIRPAWLADPKRGRRYPRTPTPR